MGNKVKYCVIFLESSKHVVALWMKSGKGLIKKVREIKFRDG
jgi:hypothetical protein